MSCFETQDLFCVERIQPATPKEMKILEIGVDEVMRYNEMWHSRLPKTDKGNLTRNTYYVFYGAEYKDHCFASAIWTTPVANNRLSTEETWLELRRLAIASDAPKFTATWMIAKMTRLIRLKFPKITKLISYQDTEVHKGTIYAAANWEKLGLTKGIEWNTSVRKRVLSQSTADKIRWTYDLKK